MATFDTQGRLLIDAGGTATRVAVGGKVRRFEGSGRPDAPLASSGLTRALRAVLDDETRDLPVVLGAAGGGSAAGRDELLRRLRALGARGPVRIVPDGYGPLASLGARGVVLLVGTGSLALARGRRGIARALGRGPVLGDPCSGVALGRLGAGLLTDALDSGARIRGGLEALAEAARRLAGTKDLEGALRALGGSPGELARLAPATLLLAPRHAALREVVRGQVARLAQGAIDAAAGAGLRTGHQVAVHGFGGVLENPWLKKTLGAALRGRGARLVEVLPEEAALEGLARLDEEGLVDARTLAVPAVGALPPTELEHPRAGDLDQAAARELVDLFLAEVGEVPGAVAERAGALTGLVEAVARSFGREGRLFYVGAGTSGRLGVLDASECPPTFHADPERVQGILAGGRRAAFEAVEGAEDVAGDGARKVKKKKVGPDDVVVGIAASGTTPYVEGALREARKRGAVTGLVTSNPGSPLIPLADHVVDVPSGPELLRGSTRLHAGTAAKLVLNTLTSAAWILSGKAFGSYMVDLRQTSQKLVGRAGRILAELLPELDELARARLLRKARGRVKTAVLMGRAEIGRKDAENLLARSAGRLRGALRAARAPATPRGRRR